MKWNERLKRIVEDQDISMAELHRRSGVPYDSINKYLRGDVDNPRGNALARLAEAVGTTETFLRTGFTERKPLSTEVIPFRGKVAAGLWREVDEGDLAPVEWLAFNPVPHYPDGAVYCLTVEGDSIDKVAPDGYTLVCVDLYASGISIRDGDLVIVERSKQQAGLIETTAKRVHIVPGGKELRPESTNPKWQPYFVPDRANDDAEQVRIIARVEYVMRRP